MSAARYRTNAVSQMTGVSTFVLRMWERRYGPIARERSEGGKRLYRDDDVERLRLLKQLVDRGHAIGDVVSLPKAELASILAKSEEGAGAATADVVRAAHEAFLAAIASFDTAGAGRALARASLALDASTFVDDLVAPLLASIGHAWEHGRFSVAQEHAATTLIRSHLELRLRPPREGDPVVLATTPEGELHEVGALAAAVIADEGGWAVRYLGPSLPAREVGVAAGQMGAALVLTSLVSPSKSLARAALFELRREVDPATNVWAGGRAVHTVAVPGVQVFHDMRSLARRLAEKRRAR